jgi:hydrogenase maturation protein HypF
VLGFAFDGAGYGADGAIWGGELLLGSYASAERVGHLAQVALPGGDAAARRPARSALAHLHAAGAPWDDRLPPVAAADTTERRVVGQMLQRGAGCTPTTSMGRLFDAVASLAGVCQDATYEGQAAIELEALSAASAAAPGSWRYDVRAEDGAVILDPAPVVRAAVSAVLAGVAAGAVGASFHDATAAAVAEAALLVREQTGVATVGLTGGVFQNTVLTRACRSRLEDHGLTVLVHRAVPPNDGGLALGQAAVVAGGGGS